MVFVGVSLYAFILLSIFLLKILEIITTFSEFIVLQPEKKTNNTFNPI